MKHHVSRCGLRRSYQNRTKTERTKAVSGFGLSSNTLKPGTSADVFLTACINNAPVTRNRVMIGGHDWLIDGCMHHEGVGRHQMYDPWSSACTL